MLRIRVPQVVLLGLLLAELDGINRSRKEQVKFGRETGMTEGIDTPRFNELERPGGVAEKL